jgi:hypothetical protein
MTERNTDQESKRATGQDQNNARAFTKEERLAVAFGVITGRLDKILAQHEADPENADVAALAAVLLANAYNAVEMYRRIMGPGGRRKVEKP